MEGLKADIQGLAQTLSEFKAICEGITKGSERENSPLRDAHFLPSEWIRQVCSLDRNRIEKLLGNDSPDSKPVFTGFRSRDTESTRLVRSYNCEDQTAKNSRRQQEQTSLPSLSSLDASYRRTIMDEERIILVFSILVTIGASPYRISQFLPVAKDQHGNFEVQPVTTYARKCLEKGNIILEECQILHTDEPPLYLLMEDLKWHNNAGACYGYIVGVPRLTATNSICAELPHFRTSSWFTRGRVLQEGPPHIVLMRRRLFLGWASLETRDVAKYLDAWSPKNGTLHGKDTETNFLDICDPLLGVFLSITKVVQNIFQSACSALLRKLRPQVRSSRVESMGKKATLFSILFYTLPVLARPIDTSASQETHCALIMHKIIQEVQNVTVLFTSPTSAKSSPAHILTASLASTTLTILLFNKLACGKPYFKHFLWTGIAISTLMGMVFALNGPGFVFRYFFFGVNLAMILSMVFHYFVVSRSSGDEGRQEFGDEKVRLVG